jgi:hypothetical protein
MITDLKTRDLRRVDEKSFIVRHLICSLDYLPLDKRNQNGLVRISADFDTACTIFMSRELTS